MGRRKPNVARMQKYQEVHFISRMRDRHGIELTESDVDRIMMFVRTNKPVLRMTNGSKLFIVPVHGDDLSVLYNTFTGRVATVYPIPYTIYGIIE